LGHLTKVIELLFESILYKTAWMKEEVNGNS